MQSGGSKNYLWLKTTLVMGTGYAIAKPAPSGDISIIKELFATRITKASYIETEAYKKTSYLINYLTNNTSGQISYTNVTMEEYTK
jgi:hypothetical protein